MNTEMNSETKAKISRETLNLPESTMRKLRAAASVLDEGSIGAIGNKAMLEWLSRNRARINQAAKSFSNRMASVLTQ